MAAVDYGDETATWVADSGFFIACGRRHNTKYTALERFARRNGITFVIPRRVHEELGGAPDRSTPGQLPIASAIDADWVTVAPELDYTNSVVSAVMDRVRRFIAETSNRNEDQIEKADTALAGVSVQLLDTGEAEFIRLVTTDIAAGEGAVSAIEAHGFESQIEFENGFELIERLTEQ